MNKIICLAGPTAIGKTDISILLAHTLKTEIVSADSVQLFRGMDIGSAKPTLLERQGIPHHLIDCVDISDKTFSVSSFRELAVRSIDDVIARGHIPLVVGGSGLYLDSLLKPLNFACPSDASVREQLENEYPLETPSAAWDALNKIDSVTANRLHPNDRKRIIRALEVYRISGKPLSEFGNDFSNSANKQGAHDALVFVLETDRERLYRRIEQRVDSMIENGLEQEVRGLYGQGYDLSYTPMQSLGYRQFIEYFEGVRSYDETVERIKLETRHFAKRQISWFNRYKDAVRIRVGDDTSKTDIVDEMYAIIEKRSTGS